MPSRLPPLRAIELFVIAGRCLSFTETAKAMNLTPSAVSRRIHALEIELGTALFRRFNRRLELTAAGARYLEAMGRALDLIERQSDAVRPRRPDKILRLSTVPLASVWLMPRLAGLKGSHPEIDIQIKTSDELVDLSEDRFDVAVRFGNGRWPGLVADRLLDLLVFPVVAPGFFQRREPASAAALDRGTFLSLAQAPRLWEQWFQGTGLGGYRPKRVQAFDSAQVMYQAAASGLGLALGDAALIADYLAAEWLVPAFSDESVPLAQSYYLVYRPALRDLSVLAALRQALQGTKSATRLR